MNRAIYTRLIDIRRRMSETKLDTQHAEQMILEEAINQMQRDFGDAVELYSLAPTSQPFVYLATWQWFPPEIDAEVQDDGDDDVVNVESEILDPLHNNPLLAKVTNRVLDMPICAKDGCGEREAHPAHFYLDKPYVQLIGGEVVETHRFHTQSPPRPGGGPRPFFGPAAYRALRVPEDVFGDDE